MYMYMFIIHNGSTGIQHNSYYDSTKFKNHENEPYLQSNAKVRTAIFDIDIHVNTTHS